MSADARVLRPLRTRIANLLARAVVKLVDDSRKRQAMQLGVLAGETVDDAEHFQPYGYKSVPLAGAEAVALFPNGDRGHPLVVVVDDRRHRPTGWEPGESGLYNGPAETVVRLKEDGTVVAGSADGSHVALATLAELNALRDWVAAQFGSPGHTHGVSGSSTNSVAAATPGAATPPTASGTSSFKAD